LWYLALFFACSGSLRLGSELLHPLSRKKRADLAVLGALVELGAVVIVCVAAVGAVRVLGVPTLARFAGEPWIGALPMVVVAAAWAPLFHGTSLWSPFPARMPHELRFPAIQIAGFLVFGFSGLPTARALDHLGTSTLVALAAGISTLGYLALWLVIRHRYARIDLVRSTT
jgi:hypothetical protein